MTFYTSQYVFKQWIIVFEPTLTNQEKLCKKLHHLRILFFADFEDVCKENSREKSNYVGKMKSTRRKYNINDLLLHFTLCCIVCSMRQCQLVCFVKWLSVNATGRGDLTFSTDRIWTNRQGGINKKWNDRFICTCNNGLSLFSFLFYARHYVSCWCDIIPKRKWDNWIKTTQNHWRLTVEGLWRVRWLTCCLFLEMKINAKYAIWLAKN